MNAEDTARLFPIDFPRWLVTAVLIFGVFLFPLYDAQNAIPPGDKEAKPPPPMSVAVQVEPSTVMNPHHDAGGDLNPSDLFYPFIIKAAESYKIDPILVRAIIKAESGYNPHAVSKKGAKGLMQLMPATAKAMGLRDVFNPERNIEAGVKYLKELLDEFSGDTSLALAAYHAGTSRVKRHGGIPPFVSTRRYVKRVLGFYADYKAEVEEGGTNEV